MTLHQERAAAVRRLVESVGEFGFLSQPKKEDLAVLKTLVEAGKVTPVIDRTYPLSEVPDAMRYLEQQHPGGKLVITM